jgi:hypothetical protein
MYKESIFLEHTQKNRIQFKENGNEVINKYLPFLDVCACLLHTVEYSLFGIRAFSMVSHLSGRQTRLCVIAYVCCLCLSVPVKHLALL